MAAGSRIARDEDVIRFVNEEDLDDGTVSGVAFDRLDRDGDTDKGPGGVSVNRLGVLVPGSGPGNRHADLSAIKAVMLSWGMPLDAQSGLARLNVGDIEDVGQRVGIALAVLEDGLAGDHKRGRLDNPAHAIIGNLPFRGDTLGAFASDLLRKKVLELLPAWP